MIIKEQNPQNLHSLSGRLAADPHMKRNQRKRGLREARGPWERATATEKKGTSKSPEPILT